MTKKERQKLMKAIDYFLANDPDKWVDGIDEIYLLIYGKKRSEHLKTGPLVTVAELIDTIQNDGIFKYAPTERET